MRHSGMTNDETIMTKECRNPNDEDFLHAAMVSSLVIDSSFVLRH